MDVLLIGERIKTLRGTESRKNLANAIGISKSALSMYERGERIPRDEIKVRMAEYFGVPVGQIFFAPKEH